MIKQIKLFTRKNGRISTQYGYHLSFEESVNLIEMVTREKVTKWELLEFYRKTLFDKVPGGIIYVTVDEELTDKLVEMKIQYSINRPNSDGIVMRPSLTFISTALVDLFVFSKSPESHYKLVEAWEEMAVRYEGNHTMFEVDPNEIFDIKGNKIVISRETSELYSSQVYVNSWQAKRLNELGMQLNKNASTVIDEAITVYQLLVDRGEITYGELS